MSKPKLRVGEFGYGIPTAARSLHITASARRLTSNRLRGWDVWAAKARNPSLSESHLSAFQFPQDTCPFTTDIRELQNGSAWSSVFSMSALTKPVWGAGCPAQSLCTCMPAHMGVHTPTAGGSSPGSPGSALSLPGLGCLTVLYCLLNALVLPFTLGIPAHKDQQPCRNGVPLSAASGLADHGHRSQGFQLLQAGSHAPGGGAGWIQATALPVVSFSPVCPQPLLPSCCRPHRSVQGMGSPTDS